MSPISVVLWITAVFYLCLLMIIGVLSFRLFLYLSKAVRESVADPAGVGASAILRVLRTIGATDLKEQGLSQAEIGEIVMAKNGAMALAQKAGGSVMGGSSGGTSGGSGILGDLGGLIEQAPKILELIDKFSAKGGGGAGGGAPPATGGGIGVK